MSWVEHFLVIHFEGRFSNVPQFDYVGGKQMEKKIDPDNICYPTIAAFIEEVGIPKENIEYLAYLESSFSLDGGENNDHDHVYEDTDAVGRVVGENNAVGPVVGEINDEKLGDKQQGAEPKCTANDSQGKEATVEDESSDTGYIESDDPVSYETKYEGEVCVKKGKKLFFDEKCEVPKIDLGMIFESPK
ncbi:hypothetical protein V6N12_031074 [Hibiscus sabdariffa]|uniref:PB1-like domain-containing protein n=1 Tax=Hibiscus sabdariffa TaxID=183260 RepID=A0ABR2E7T9_9ROSI